MEVIQYILKVKNPEHFHEPDYARILYVPEEDVALSCATRETHGGIEYSLLEDQERLDDARAIARGEDPSTDDIAYYDVRKFEYDTNKLQLLIEDVRSKDKLDLKVESGFVDLFRKSACVLISELVAK